MTTSKIQRGDNVKVIAGKYRGSTGTVTSVYTKTLKNKTTTKRAVVSGLPMITNYKKAYKTYGMPGEMTQVDRSIHISNLSHTTSDGVVSRVRVVEGKRVLAKNNVLVSVPSLKASKEIETVKEKKTAKKTTTKPSKE
jgi:large subunit ribosomal protein L24